MGFLLRSTIGIVLLLGLAYGLFFVNVEGRSVGSHLTDIWSSEVVQDKLSLVKDGVRNELEERLAAATKDAARDAVRERQGSTDTPHGDIQEEDRRKLEAMLEDSR